MSGISAGDRRFYEDEELRWPQLHGVPISGGSARRALRALADRFCMPRVPLVFIPGDVSWGGSAGIELAESRDWLVFAHEFAHVLDCFRHGDTHHNKRMAMIVDEVVGVVLAADWPTIDLNRQVDRLLARQQVWTPSAAPQG